MLDLNQKSKQATAFKLVVTLAFVLLGIVYFLANRDEFTQLHWPSPIAVVAVALAFVTNLWLGSLFNNVVVRKLGADISGIESFALSTVASAINFLLPLRAGAGVRAVYLKRVFNLPYSHFASTLAVFYLANVFIASIVGMACVLFIYLDTRYFKLDLFLAPPIAFLIAGGFIFLKKSNASEDDAASSPWKHFATGFRRILADRRSAMLALSIVAASFVVSTIGWTIALRDYAPTVTIPESFLIVASQIIGGLVTLTAGGTGFQEIAGLYVGHRLGVTSVELFAVLVWTKALRILLSIVLATPSMVYLRKRMQRAAPGTPD